MFNSTSLITPNVLSLKLFHKIASSVFGYVLMVGQIKGAVFESVALRAMVAFISCNAQHTLVAPAAVFVEVTSQDGALHCCIDTVTVSADLPYEVSWSRPQKFIFKYPVIK
jgi:hypothetical protein